MKKILAIALVLALGLFAWSFMHLLDVSVSIDDARMETRHRTQQAILLRSMLNHVSVGMERAALLRLLADDMAGDRLVIIYPDRVEIDPVIFRFRDDKVATSSFSGKSETRWSRRKMPMPGASWPFCASGSTRGAI